MYYFTSLFSHLRLISAAGWVTANHITSSAHKSIFTVILGSRIRISLYCIASLAPMSLIDSQAPLDRSLSLSPRMVCSYDIWLTPTKPSL